MREVVTTVSHQKSPYTKHLLLTPSHTQKDFLSETFLESVGCYFGVKFMTLEKGVFFLLENFLSDKPFFADPLTLPFIVEDFILTHADLLLQQPGGSYLQPFLTDTEQRWQLAKILSQEFIQWQFFPLHHFVTQKDWTECLFTKVSEKIFFFHQFNQQEFHPPEQSFFLHIVGFTHIPPEIVRFFSHISSYLHVKYYTFSPSKYYWWDSASEKKLEKMRRFFPTQSFDDYIQLTKDDHRLLANFTSHGAFLFSLIENFSMDHEFVSSSSSSLLTHLQNDLLDACITPFRGSVTNIAIHRAPSKLREVEILEYEIRRLIFEEKVTEKDIWVFCPDIQQYTPLIRYVFEREHQELGYKILEVKSSEEHVLHHLFDLFDSKWDKKDLEALFLHAAFYQRHDMSYESVEIFADFLARSTFAWGFHQKHKQEILEEEDVSPRGTLLFAYEAFLSSLGKEGENFLIIPSLHRWIEIFSTLFTSITEIKCGCWDLLTWHRKLKDFLQQFLTDCSEVDLFLTKLWKLTHISFLQHPISFATIKLFISDVLQISSHDIERKDHFITFSHLSPHHVTTKAIIFILGCDEELFPSKIDHNSLSRDLYKGSMLPSQVAKYSLLQILLNAKKLVISFSEISSDGKQQEISLIIKELMDFIEKSYGVCLYQRLHYASDFHPFYFSRPNAHTKWSSLFEKKPLATIPSCIEEEIITIDLSDLKTLLSHPLRFYAQKALGIFLSEDKEKVALLFSKEEESLLKNAALQAIKKGEDFHHLFDQGHESSLKKAKMDRLLHDMKKTQKALHELSYHDIQPIDLIFSTSIETPQKRESAYLLPAPSFIFQGKKIVITGKIADVYDEGIFLFTHGGKQQKLEELFRLSLIKKALPSFKKIIFVENQLHWKAPFVNLQDPHFEYFFAAKNAPSPLFAATLLLVHKEKQLTPSLWEKSVQSPFFDPYLHHISPSFDKNWLEYFALFEEVLHDIS